MRLQGKEIGYILILFLIYGLYLGYNRLGLFMVPPHGLRPDGLTSVVWRQAGEPFFNSPDAISIRGEDPVYISRLQYPFLYRADRVITNLPYMDWAYRYSIAGLQIDNR
jgi:hypothetical protein